jgi:hypothetical protein
VEGWLQAEPDVTAKALMQRLCEQFPDVYPTATQLRTLQRRVQLWRNEQVKRLIFQSSGTPLISSDALSVNHNGEATTNIRRVKNQYGFLVRQDGKKSVRLPGEARRQGLMDVADEMDEKGQVAGGSICRNPFTEPLRILVDFRGDAIPWWAPRSHILLSVLMADVDVMPRSRCPVFLVKLGVGPNRCRSYRLFD